MSVVNWNAYQEIRKEGPAGVQRRAYVAVTIQGSTFLPLPTWPPRCVRHLSVAV